MTATDDQTFTEPDGTTGHYESTEKLTLKYDKFASLEFTMIISVVRLAMFCCQQLFTTGHRRRGAAYYVHL